MWPEARPVWLATVRPSEALHGLVREAFLAVPGGGVRLHLALAEVADRRLDVTVLVGEREIHLVRSLRKRRSPRDVRPDPVDDLLRGGAGREDPGDAGPGERRHVLVGDDAAAEDQLIAAAPLAQLLDDGGKECQVRTGEDREPDRVHEELRKRGGGDKLVFGGGIIPDEDMPALARAGVARVFTPGASTQEIVDWIRANVPRRASLA